MVCERERRVRAPRKKNGLFISPRKTDAPPHRHTRAHTLSNTNTAAMPPVTFPLMTDDELASALATFGLPLPDGGLTKPTADGMRPLYEHLVCALSGVTR